MSSFNHRECLGCGQPCDGLYYYLCTCQQCEVSLINGICLNFTYRDGKPLICYECEGLLRGGFCWFYDSRVETSFAYDPNSNSFDDSQNLSNYPPQPQCETYLSELCGNDSHYGYDCPPRFPLVYEQEPMRIPRTLSKSDEFIKSSVKDLVLIPSESEDTSESDSECILPLCDYFSPIDVPEEKSVTFSNPLFNSNVDFTSGDDESLFDKDVLENIKSKDSYDSNLDEPDLLVTPLFDDNEDECFDSGGDVNKINDFEDGYYDSEGDILYFESLLSDDTIPNLPPE
nr:hypothetical protein [Tanacetum cinerariifolium]